MHFDILADLNEIFKTKFMRFWAIFALRFVRFTIFMLLHNTNIITFGKQYYNV